MVWRRQRAFVGNLVDETSGASQIRRSGKARNRVHPTFRARPNHFVALFALVVAGERVEAGCTHNWTPTGSAERLSPAELDQILTAAGPRDSGPAERQREVSR